LSEIIFSSKKRNHLWKLLLLQENVSSKKTSPPRKEIIYGICFSSKKTSSKKTSPPRKEITYGIILLELESR
jgi:hypothetical protein